MRAGIFNARSFFRSALISREILIRYRHRFRKNSEKEIKEVAPATAKRNYLLLFFISILALEEIS